MGFDPSVDYPLGARPDLVSTPGGHALDEVTLDAVRDGRIGADELLVPPDQGLGLVAMDGPNDPEPSLVVEAGRVVEIDGRREADFDVIDHFLARHGIDGDSAAEAQALTDDEIARRLVDVDTPRDE